MPQTTLSSASSILEFQEPLEEARPRLKVLICAFACSPMRGSEHGVGWGWIEAISKYHDLWVLCSDECKEEIEEELQRRPKLRSNMHFYYLPWTRHTIAEKIWPPEHLLNYRKWQDKCFDLAKRLAKEIDFDIVHQLTYVGFRVPGLFWRLGIPFVWGPIGGLEQTTWSLIPWLGLRGALHFTARNLLNERDRRFARLPKQAFAATDGAVIAATTGIQREIQRFYGCSSTVISEIGLPPVTKQTPARRSAHDKLRLLWCGNLKPGKALPFLFSALSMLPSCYDFQLTIIGEGPCWAGWRNAARRKGLDSRCEWLGKVPRSVVLEKMQQAHALVVTSVYDLTSTVVVEALANGLPVICPDHCGFRDAITPECGIRVKASTRREIVEGLRDAIAQIVDEDLRFQLAQGALVRSRDYEWEWKARAVDSIYRAKQLQKENTRMVAR